MKFKIKVHIVETFHPSRFIVEERIMELVMLQESLHQVEGHKHRTFWGMS
jgi:hypothetical protein